ncbi:MAG: hypothetical protein LUO91_05935 [Methanomicrobiales archaeon]|jgi:hypothetical protein|nr:hypothetical protein [Methanomicrobiales archaeon]
MYWWRGKGLGDVLLPLLATVLLLAGTGVVGVARAGSESESSFKIDVGIFLDVNPTNNPIHEDPGDLQEFQFDVRYVVTRTPLCTILGPLPTDTGEIGRFTAWQGNTVQVPKVAGQAGDHIIDYCVLPLPLVGYSYPADDTCLGFICPVQESIGYEIDHYRIPQGYCPQYPDGQDRKKEDTQTENMKFYRGTACGEVYPGYDGAFAWGECRPRRCTIRIG